MFFQPKKQHMPNVTVTRNRHSCTSGSTEPREQSTWLPKLGHSGTVTPKLQEKPVTEKQVQPIIEPQQSKYGKQMKPKTRTTIPTRPKVFEKKPQF
jgi:hypothetical protein